MNPSTETEPPRPLAQEIPSFDGRKLVQLKREGNVALYAQIRQSDGVTTSHEVIKIKTRPAEEVFGRAQPYRESYPKSSDWGYLGWTYGSLTKAEEAFAELVGGATRPTR